MIGLVCASADSRQLTKDLFAWYCSTNLPIYQPEAAAPVQTVAPSVNCIDSITKFMTAANVERGDIIRKRRCGGLSGDVARRTVELHFAVYSLAVDFFLVAGDSLATPMLSIDKYVSFLFGFLVPFGVAFQLPVVLYLTTRVGLTTPDMLRSKRKYVILAIFVLAAILTPPDVVSQVALGLPMCGLYEIGILVSRCTKARERA